MLTVWGRKTSSNVQALMWCIGEMNLPFKRHDVGHKYGGTDSDEFYALNPNRTIPVLQDDSCAPLWETGAILRYLANRYGAESFWPSELLAKTEVDRWAEWSKLNIAQAFTAPVFWRVVRTPEDKRNAEAISSAVESFETKLQIAEERLEKQSFLVGESLTLADIQFGHVLYRYYDINIDRRPLPNVQAYYMRLTSRQAFREHVMVSYDELRA